MKAMKKSTLLTGIMLAAVLLLALGIAAPALSKSSMFSLLAPTSAPTPAAGDVIPLKSIAGLTSLNATVKINVNGLINNKRAQGDMTAELTTSDQGSKITVTGPLLGDITAQVGGSLVGLFTPSSVDIYKVPQGNFIVVNSLIPVCIKPSSPKATEAFDQLSPQNLLGMFTNSDVARGELVDKMTVNGVPVNHYVINGEAFLAAAQKSQDEKLKEFGDALWHAKDADLYVDPKGGYPLAFSGSFSGSYDPLKFQGDFDVQIELTGINQETSVRVPLIYRSELLGILNVESELPAAYTETDEELLGTLGGSLAAIIANARLLEQIRAQAERERVRYEITDKIRRTTDMQTILTTTVSELTCAVGANHARIKVGIEPKADKKATS